MVLGQSVASPGDNDLDRREEQELLDALRKATIGEYDIYSQIGRGGMATVFLALELSLNRPVAIKVISPSALSNTTIIDRFWLEARTAASLSHPHVIPIFAVKSAGGLHFFVMKHVQGGSLDAILRTEGPFPFSLAWTILDQVSGALAYAHRRGVIHRDIKPANIMLDDEGFAVVMDFGIAKVRDVAALTASGAMVGTPFYMSPEQFSGEQVDGRSDQYSLGVVAFELITGKRPFKGSSVPEVLRGHLIDKVPDVRDLRSDCPTLLATIINRMLSKKATDRFASMEVLCNELDSMPRINKDRMRETISSLARTASLSAPQISEPVSPSPPSRSSAKQDGQIATTSRARSGIATASRLVRKRPVLSGATAAGIIGIAAFALSANTDGQRRNFRSNDSAAPPSASIVSAKTDTPRVTTSNASDSATAASPQLVDPQGPVTDKPVPAKHDASRGPVEEKRLSRKTREPDLRSRAAVADDRVQAPVLNNSVLLMSPNQIVQPVDSPAPVPVAAPPTPQTAFRIGARLPASFLYVDGQFVGRIGNLSVYRHDPGRVHLQIRAEDCMSWDSTFSLKVGDTAVIGYRNPRCTK